MNPRLTLAILSAQLLLTSLALADDFPDPGAIAEIRKNWRCQWCPDSDIATGRKQVDAGIAYQSNDSFRYGDFSGLDSKGGYLLLSAYYDSADEQNTRYSVAAQDLGLDSRSLNMLMEYPNLFAAIKYNALPHLQSDNARTPYSGGEDQRLPSAWVYGSNPKNLSALAASLAPVDLYQTRQNYQLALKTKPSRGVQYSLSFQQSHKHGNKSAGVAVGDIYGAAYSALLALPVDNVTRQGEIAAHLNQGALQLNAAYAFSNFDNRIDAVRFDYAYSAPSVTRGQVSSEPDNQMHQLSLAAQYQHSLAAQTSAQLSLAQAKQSQAYLPYSLSSNQYPIDSSLHARIDYFDANIKHVRHLGERLQLLLQYRDSEQDNKSERQSFGYYVADTATLGDPRSNMPFGFRTQDASAVLDYHLAAVPHTLSAALTLKQQDRTYQSVSKSRDTELSLSYRAPLSKAWYFRGKLAQTQRRGDDYVSLSELTKAENPLLRDYHLADRTLRHASMWWNYIGDGGVDVALQSRRSQSVYDAELGLKDYRELFHALNIGYAVNKRVRLDGGVDYFDTRSVQSGSSSFAQPNWRYQLNSRDQQARIAIRYRPQWRGLVTGAEWAWLNSRLGADNDQATAFPDAVLRRQTVLLYGDYDIDSHSQVRAFYRYQKYREDNWQRDAFAIDGLGQVLTLGEISPRYDIGFIGVSYSRRW